MLMFVSLAMLPGLTPSDAAPAPELALNRVFSRVPSLAWDTIGYADYQRTMEKLGTVWPPEQGASLSPTQATGWQSAWKPPLLAQDVTQLGFSPYTLHYAIEARHRTTFALWLEGRFDVGSIAAALDDQGYRRVDTLAVETYQAPEDSIWHQAAGYIALPDGQTLLISNREETLRAMLGLYDGVFPPFVEDNRLLQRLEEITPHPLSGIIRFDQNTTACALVSSRLALHGVYYDAERATWQYLLNVGYDNDAPRDQIGTLADGLEYSVHPTQPAFQGVLGQYTTVLAENLYENPGGIDIMQFRLRLRDTPGIQQLPIFLGQQRDTCQLFRAPPAAATPLALAYLPDLSANRLDVLLRFGNVEQALYNAGLSAPLREADQRLNNLQQTSLNSTWRTVLAYETAFGEWFGFSPQNIEQSVELTLDTDDYVRILWGAFTREQIEDALLATGYVPIEQYQGARIFTLRDIPETGGVMLRSLTQTAAAPAPGILIFTNNTTNMRLTVDLINENFRSALVRDPELVLVAQAVGDATHAAVRRFANRVMGGLVCGLPGYRVDALANVLRPNGWHFLYAVGFNTALEAPQAQLDALAAALESSDYPLQGPGSETFGQLSEVVATHIITEGTATVLLVDLLVSANAQRASSFAQDLPTANLPPCVLGDITR